MSARQGLGHVTQIKFGSAGVNVGEIRLGTTLLWSASALTDYADRPDSIGLGPDWTDVGPSVAPAMASIVSGQFCMNIEDDPKLTLPTETSNQVYTAGEAAGDDGYIATVVTTVGDYGLASTGLVTILWRRSDSDFTNGVGMQIDGSTNTVSIISRVFSSNTVQPADLSFQPGDILELKQTGDQHKLTVSGATASFTVWNDTLSEVSQGSAFRRMALTLQGSRILSDSDPTLPPVAPEDIVAIRVLSPCLDYVEMG